MEQTRQRFRDRPVRLKWLLLTALILIVLGAILWALGAWQRVEMRRDARAAVREQIRARGEAMAQAIAVTGREDILNRDYAALQQGFNELVRRPDVRYLIVMTPNRRAVVHTNAAFRGKVLQDEVSRNAASSIETKVQDIEREDIYDIAVPVMGLTSRAALVRVGISYADAEQLFRR